MIKTKQREIAGRPRHVTERIGDVSILAYYNEGREEVAPGIVVREHRPMDVRAAFKDRLYREKINDVIWGRL